MNPYIHMHKDGSIDIIGEPSGLNALGELLISKSKLGRNLSATLRDTINPDIRIISSDDILSDIPAEGNKKG